MAKGDLQNCFSLVVVSQGCARLAKSLQAFCKSFSQFLQVKKGLVKSSQVEKGLEKFLQLCLLFVLQHTLLTSFARQKETCEIDGCQIPSLILFLAHLIDLAKASKPWILHVLRFNQLCYERNKVLSHSWLILMIKKLLTTPKITKN